MILLIIKEDSIIMEDWGVNSRKSSIQTLKPHFSEDPELSSASPNVIAWNHRYIR